MKTIKAKLIIILGIIFLINFAVGYYVMFEIGKVNDLLRTEPNDAITAIQKVSNQNYLSESIRYYDEVLTQSARNYAFTGNVIWKNRYNDNVQKLDSAISDAIKNGNQTEKNIFENINSANYLLVEMETRSIQLVDNGNKLNAQSILDSSIYKDQKSIYQSGLDQYYSINKVSNDNIEKSSYNKLRTINSNVSKENIKIGLFFGLIIVVVMISTIIIFLLAYYLVIKPVSILKKATDEVAHGNLDQKINIKSKNELGELAMSFNKMASELKESKADIDKKITARTEELEKLNHFMTGRELKMIELKKQIKDLEVKNEIKK